MAFLPIAELAVLILIFRGNQIPEPDLTGVIRELPVSWTPIAAGSARIVLA
jgi:hypothetical protein